MISTLHAVLFVALIVVAVASYFASRKWVGITSGDILALFSISASVLFVVWILTTNLTWWLVSGFVVSVVAVGFDHYQLPYRRYTPNIALRQCGVLAAAIATLAGITFLVI